MRAYQANRELGHAEAGERCELLLRHAERVEAEIETLRFPSTTCAPTAALWDARDRAHTGAEAEANLQVQKMLPPVEEVVLG